MIKEWLFHQSPFPQKTKWASVHGGNLSMLLVHWSSANAWKTRFYFVDGVPSFLMFNWNKGIFLYQKKAWVGRIDNLCLWMDITTTEDSGTWLMIAFMPLSYPVEYSKNTVYLVSWPDNIHIIYRINTNHSVLFNVLKEWKKFVFSYATGHINEPCAEPAVGHPGSCRRQVHYHRVLMQAFPLFVHGHHVHVYRKPCSVVFGKRWPCTESPY